MKTRILTLIVSLFVTTMAFAYDAEIDGIYYDFDHENKTATVTYDDFDYRYNDYAGYLKSEIIIPERVTYKGEGYSVVSIGANAFYKCSSIASIAIPSSVTSIGERAFYKCSSIASIAIPNSVTSIGYDAFLGCSSLTSVTIGNSVTSIGYEAFLDCSSLTSVTIGNSVTSIGDNAFDGCSSLTSITIPNSVTSIGELVFQDCSSLTSIDVDANNPNYASIDGMLYDKKRITLIACPSGKTEVSIPNSVTSIGNKAFYGCSSLTSITIPNSVTSIGGSAFYGCTGLTSIEIGNNVASIGVYAFADCTSLSSVKWNAINYDISSSSNTPFYYYYDLKYDLRKQITSFIFGEDVKHIPAYLCSGMSNLETVEIPNSVTGIGRHAFANTSITSIVIPENVTSIGEFALGSSSLLSVEWNAKHCKDFSSYNYTPFSYYEYPHYVQVNNVKTFIFGDSVEHIPAYLCYVPDSLTSITMTNSVGIGEDAFLNRSSLMDINIRAKDVNDYCENNSNDLLYQFKANKHLIINGEEVINLKIPEGVEIINSAFRGFSSFVSVEIPNSVKEIGKNAFQSCTGLTSVEIPNSVTLIGDYAFSGCSSLTSIEIPNSVTTIGANAFESCTGLTSVEIPNSVTLIGDYAFYGCSSLTSIEIPNSVTEIGNRPFNGCSNLTSVVWNAVSCRGSMGESLFYGSGIKIIIFGDSVEYIPSYLCCECVELTSIVISNNVTSIGDYAFSGCSAITSVNITAKSVEDYCENSGINRLLYDLICQRNLIVDGEEIKDLVIPEGVDTIGDYAFYKFSSLTSLTIPNSVTSIGDGAFYDCNKVRTLNIGSAIESIGLSAFASCDAIYSIDIDAIVPPIIEYSTFNNVSRTAHIKVPCGSVATYQASSYWNEFTNYIESPYTLSVEVNDETMGMAVVTKQNTCTDITATVQAQARPGYEFVKWSDGFTENPHTVFVMEDMSITAEFASMPKEYNVSVVCDVTMGTVTGSGTYKEGESVTIEAIADEGYRFVEWSDGNSENPRTIVVTEDVELQAEFAINQYEVNVTADENGYATGSGTYDYGTEVTIEAIADEGYRFVKWSDGNTENPRTIVVTEDVELTAEFELDGTPVDNVDESSVIVYVQDGVIYIEGSDADYNVFDASGRLIYTGRDAQLQLPRGVYVIAVGGEVEKVVL